MSDWLTEEKERWMEAMKAKGHVPVVEDDGSLDMFVCDGGYHNGPGCSSCGWSTCHHCERIEDIPECDNPALELKANK